MTKNTLPRVQVGLIDHGAGNLVSIGQGLQQAGADVSVVTEPGELDRMEALVLPGVGTTGATMARLSQAGLVEPLRKWQGPLLGICVGLQLFFTSSQEDGSQCLDLDPGMVRRLEEAPLLPHIGWNNLQFNDDPMFSGIPPDACFYFVHSYAPVPEDTSIITAYSYYPNPFVAAVRNGNRVGVQFHPERSGASGLLLLSNFVKEISAQLSQAAR